MAAFSDLLQKMVSLSGLRMETGAGVTIAGVSGQDFTIATKLRKVMVGFGVTHTDGMVCVATPAVVVGDSGNQVTFSRKGDIETSADTVTYILFGY